MNFIPIHIFSTNSYEKNMWQAYFKQMSYQTFEIPNIEGEISNRIREMHFYLYEFLTGTYDVYRLIYHRLFEVEQQFFTYEQLIAYAQKNHFFTVNITTILILKCRHHAFTEISETSVRFSPLYLKNLEKYIKTKEPFLCDVSYNRVGEGQHDRDGGIGLFTHSIGLPFHAVHTLLKRMGDVEQHCEVMP